MVGKSSGRKDRATTDDVCVVEIAMQLGAGMQVGRRAGRREAEAAGHCLDARMLVVVDQEAPDQ